MKLLTVHYMGFTAMDRRFSNPMLPWIVSEIRKRDCYERVSLGVEDGVLQAYNSDFELQFSHHVQNMSRFSQADIDPCTFLYLVRDDGEQLLYCYLFQALKASDVADLYQQMKDNQNTTPTKSLSSASSLTSLSIDISPSSSNFIEVLYIGKIKVWNKKVPDTFIDDALEKFKAHDEEIRSRLHGSPETMRGDGLQRRSSIDSNYNSTNVTETTKFPPNLIRSSTLSSISVKSPEIAEMPLSETPDKPSLPLGVTECQESPEEICDNVSPNPLCHIKRVKFKTRSFSENSMADDIPTTADSSENAAHPHENEATSAKYSMKFDDHNRTMVLQVGRGDLRLISPDRKLVLLHKQNRDITTCAKGILNPTHFGFICREVNTANAYIGYVFKCDSLSVANEAVGAISQALTNADYKYIRPVITSCEHCPMVWYHKLCAEIEHLTDRKTHGAILRKLETLEEEEQTIILTKFRGAETDSLREQNEFLMMLLRAHCEMKQGRHVHDTAENRSEFLNQYLGGSTIFTKARRTLTNSFDNLLKRKASREDISSVLKDMSLPIHSLSREASPHVSDDSDGFRSRSSTIGSVNDLKDRLSVKDSKILVSPERHLADKTLKSPMMDIFFKVGSSPKLTVPEEGSPKLDTGSWRQAMFKRVITPSKQEICLKKRSKEELRMLWKKSIHQAILLVRMEKENAKLKAKQEENAVRRIKLEYDELKLNQREVIEVWDMITNKETRVTVKTDNQLLLQAIRRGIPRSKRGEVWHFLAEHYCVNIAPIDTNKFPNYNIQYESLLKQLTSHQHAILIDLGRTFPSHSYYSSSLGPGQLALFNLLKAYSLLDPEVGYCQGLSFVAGVLLLHMEESQAFFLLRHLMFRRGLRNQYLPDMIGLQVKLYQLSRLVRDQLPDLYQHFDFYEVAPTLYAAPWLLTLFASQFPLGFVTRVFDFLFLENTDVIFRVALALLLLHKEELLMCDSFEEIMNYLKLKLPAIDKIMLEKVMKEVVSSDISKQLNEYLVEYQVLQEELASVQPQVEALQKMEAQNKTLTEQNGALMAQLELTLGNIQRLEKNRSAQQASINRLEVQNRGLEVTITTLGAFIHSVIEQKIDVDIPDDVRRILSQLTFAEERRNEKNNGMRIIKSPQDKMIKSLSTGRIISKDLRVQESDILRSNSLTARSRAPFSLSSLNQIKPLVDIKIQDCLGNDAHKLKSTSDCTDINKYNFLKMDEKSVSLPLCEKLPVYGNKTSPTSSIDSGIGTPLTPSAHPLSNCDVQFTFNGTRELLNKTLKSTARKSSTDLSSK
ncbi:TBC1 domain family member 1 isoform X1 [Photinus pyralis]|uniref:Rab-GAP TBC domain-containing protein n=2 Tax=Photinus pyralis TaxID=7054 RepID=A0A1Y1KDU9_PHOPY|nr:TBC1 domain family member 1 isoform X1 [Photinus pyralis]